MITILALIATILVGFLVWGTYIATPPTLAPPTNAQQNFRSIVCCAVNSYFALVLSWIGWGIIIGFCLVFGITNPEAKYMVVLISMGTVMGSVVVNLFNLVKPNSNSVQRVQNNLNPIRRELVRGQDTVDIAFKFLGGMYGIKAFFEKKLGNEINTESERSVDFEIEVTCFDDNLMVGVRLFFKPAQRLTDVFGSRGETEKDRKANVKDEIEGVMSGAVEQLLHPYDARDIIANYSGINRLLSRRFTRHEAGLEKSTGSTITSVLVVKIDQSDEAKKAHTTRGNINQYKLAALELIEAAEERGETMTMGVALNKALLIGDEAEGYFFEGLDGVDPKSKGFIAANAMKGSN